MYDELQSYAFTTNGLTLDALNRKSTRLAEEYALTTVGPEGLDYGWIENAHNFSSPMYYISYATSIVPALQIMDLSLTDRPKAIQVYNDIVASDPELSFSEVVQQAGLGDPFDEQTIVDVVNAIVDYTGVGRHVSVG